MLNQVAVEALYSATYVENYLDSVENLPGDVQRHMSRIRELDVQHNSKSINALFSIQMSSCCLNTNLVSVLCVCVQHIFETLNIITKTG